MASLGKPLRKHLGRLRDEASVCADPVKSAELSAKIRKLEADLAAITHPPGNPKKTPKAPVPKSYRDEVREKIETAHKASKFHSRRVHFVQGGSASGK